MSTNIYVAGWNMPGYLPDAELAYFETFAEAREWMVGELVRWLWDGDEEYYPCAALDEALRHWRFRATGPETVLVGDWAFWIEQV